MRVDAQGVQEFEHCQGEEREGSNENGGLVERRDQQSDGV